jgi:hypothetical protein
MKCEDSLLVQGCTPRRATACGPRPGSASEREPPHLDAVNLQRKAIGGSAVPQWPSSGIVSQGPGLADTVSALVFPVLARSHLIAGTMRSSPLPSSEGMHPAAG